ncbi:MAG: hypothetical protein OHK0046_34700 [Anaerolineae bacterium]
MGIEKQSPNKTTRIARQDNLLDDDNRIDWDRKQKHRREEEVEVDTPVEEVEDVILDSVEVAYQAVGKSHKHKKGKEKRRHLEYDEEVGRVVVKRKRKRRYDDWDHEL